MCPYLVVAGNTQTTNASDDFGKKVATLCESAAHSAKYCVVLNHSTKSHMRLNGTSKLFLIIWQTSLLSYIVHCLAHTMQNVAAIRQWADRVLPV